MREESFEGTSVPISTIHTFLIHPNKAGKISNPVIGNHVPLTGKMFELLREIFDRTEEECKVGIQFFPSEEGKQENECRSQIIAYIKDPTLLTGTAIATRLSNVTTNRSGMGLLFLILGTNGNGNKKIVISRFPANNGILVDDTSTTLEVSFIEKVFMKNTHLYKSVHYSSASMTTGFWTGMAIDKQIEYRELDASQYWVYEFLQSGLQTTPAAGTRRLAQALKRASMATKSLDIKRQIASIPPLAQGLQGQLFTIETFMDRFNLSKNTKEAIASEIKNKDTIGSSFQFDSQEFSRQLPYRSLELDNGAILTGPSQDFDKIFDSDEVDGRTRISTVGEIVSDKIRKTK